MTQNSQHAKKIEELILSDDEMTIDIEFYLDNHDDGNDWKAFIWYDKELGKWCLPTYFTAAATDKNSAFNDTEEPPPQQLVDHIAEYIKSSIYNSHIHNL
jgi:hypothetical protein